MADYKSRTVKDCRMSSTVECGGGPIYRPTMSWSLWITASSPTLETRTKSASTLTTTAEWRPQVTLCMEDHLSSMLPLSLSSPPTLTPTALVYLASWSHSCLSVKCSLPCSVFCSGFCLPYLWSSTALACMHMVVPFASKCPSWNRLHILSSSPLSSLSPLSHPLVLPPVLVPRNPQVVSQRYEPVPSYLDTQRSPYSPNEYHPIYDNPGKLLFMLLVVHWRSNPEVWAMFKSKLWDQWNMSFDCFKQLQQPWLFVFWFHKTVLNK